MRKEHFHETSLKVRVLRGHDGFWRIICQLAESQGQFTVKDIEGESCVSVTDIDGYVRALANAGFIEKVREARLAAKGRRGSFVSAVYRLVKLQATTPRVRADGSLICPTAQEQLWTTMRTLRTFGLRDLIFAASTPDVKPTYAMAKRYATRLTTAGYLTVLQPKTRSSTQVWRLKPGMDTGPKPPALKVIRADAMWDPNLKAFVGGAPTAMEVSP